MKKTLLLLLLCCAAGIRSQHTISGNFPAEYTWIIAYQLLPGSENFISEAKILEGRFTLNIPKNSATGMYRLVYGVPQEDHYVDVLYNRNEDIELTFEHKQGLAFLSSEENTNLYSYYKEIAAAEQDLMIYYASAKNSPAEFGNLIEKLKRVQENYETRTDHLIAYHFIAANSPYIPTAGESPATYMGKRQSHSLINPDFSDTVLQASDFLKDKFIDYVMPAIQADSIKADVADISVLIAEAAKQIQAENGRFRLKLFYGLWLRLSEAGFYDAAQEVYSGYLKSLAVLHGPLALQEELAALNSLQPGARAPDIIWQKGDETRSLNGLHDADYYVLIFWSSGCSHCLHELPIVHDALREISGIQVIAVGLEDNQTSWLKESAKFPLFEHAISLGKWESRYSKLYAIKKTPTYFVLDADKRILYQPEEYEDLFNYLKNPPKW